LLEALAATAFLAIALMAFAANTVALTRNEKSADSTSVAHALAQQKLEQLRSMPLGAAQTNPGLYMEGSTLRADGTPSGLTRNWTISAKTSRPGDEDGDRDCLLARFAAARRAHVHPLQQDSLLRNRPHGVAVRLLWSGARGRRRSSLPLPPFVTPVRSTRIWKGTRGGRWVLAGLADTRERRSHGWLPSTPGACSAATAQRPLKNPAERGVRGCPRATETWPRRYVEQPARSRTPPEAAYECRRRRAGARRPTPVRLRRGGGQLVGAGGPKDPVRRCCVRLNRGRAAWSVSSDSPRDRLEALLLHLRR
jgi:hypothetical protein